MTTEKKTAVLCVVHCVDTEGPLWESEDATRERLAQILGKGAASGSLQDLRAGKGVPEEKKEVVRRLLDPRLMAYKRDWAGLDEMLSELFSEEWRAARKDSVGGTYVFNWFTMDHLGFTHNPRRRAMGYHVIYEHYRQWLDRSPHVRDEIYWHYHPPSFDGQGHKCSANFSYSNLHLDILGRRILDHLHFPAAFRPGQHTERPDISWFLEMWIPFDYANQAMEESEMDRMQQDISGGRFGDWRRAPRIWGHYHPDFYDYQIVGNMRRYVYRCLNLGSRLRHITKGDVKQAFQEAQERGCAVLSVATHDFRDMREDTDLFIGMIRDVESEFPDVEIRFCNAVEAARMEAGLRREEAPRLEIAREGTTVVVKANKPLWGAQPFFCMKTRDNRCLHENLDYHGGLHWSYTLDELTLPWSALESLGFAANDNLGQTCVYRVTDLDGEFRIEEKHWNLCD